MYYVMCVSAPSLHRESTDALIKTLYGSFICIFYSERGERHSHPHPNNATHLRTSQTHNIDNKQSIILGFTE